MWRWSTATLSARLLIILSLVPACSCRGCCRRQVAPNLTTVPIDFNQIMSLAGLYIVVLAMTQVTLVANIHRSTAHQSVARRFKINESIRSILGVYLPIALQSLKAAQIKAAKEQVLRTLDLGSYAEELPHRFWQVHVEHRRSCRCCGSQSPI